MIKAKKSISPNNTVFFSEKNEDDFEKIIVKISINLIKD